MKQTKSALAAVGLALLSIGAPARAHRADEYLQATTISLEKDRIQARIRLTPGVAVLGAVLGAIDIDADGALSPAEQRAYTERVLADLSLSIDSSRLKPQLKSTAFPSVAELQAGVGEIRIDFTAEVPRGRAARKLVFDNRHQRPIAAYLVNSLEPSDPDIRVTAQRRNYEQSHYELDYTLAGVSSSSSFWLDAPVLLAVAAVLLLVARLALARRERRA